MNQRRYNRVLVKLSGEALCKPGQRGIDGDALETLVGEIKTVVDKGVQLALVVGGGNILRGRDLHADPSIRRTTADSMGMLATIVNALALRDTLEGAGIGATVLSASPLPRFCDLFTPERAMDALNAGKVLIAAGGTGNPFFTTDSCASLRALEIGAEVLLKATKVDGVYDSDPAENPDATRYDSLSYEKVLAERLGVMDLTAISMCMENNLPIVVFNLFQAGSLAAAVDGKDIGTTVGT